MLRPCSTTEVAVALSGACLSPSKRVTVVLMLKIRVLWNRKEKREKKKKKEASHLVFVQTYHVFVKLRLFNE